MKIRLAILLLCFLATSTACRKNQEHLSAKTMQKILLDMHIAEAYSTMAKDSLHKAGVKNTDSLEVFYRNILAHYKITQQEFTGSLAWYKNHPGDLDSIYARMQATVNKWQTKGAHGAK